MAPQYDFSAFIDRLGGDMEFVAECIELFEQEAPAALASVRDAVAGGSADLVSNAAHALKGMAGNFSAAGPAATAARLDRLARDGDLSEAAALMSRLEAEVPELVAALRPLKTPSS